MSRLSVLFLVACTTARSSHVPVEPAKPVGEPAKPVGVTPTVQHAPALDEATVKERTHAWLDTFDRADPQGFAEPLGASFVWFKDSQFMDKALVTSGLQRRKDRHLPIATRTWGEERVFVAEDVAIYAGADARLVARIKPSLKRGGLFISEHFHTESDVTKRGVRGWATGELAALFKDGFKILRDDVVEGNADWAGQRKTKLARFVAQKL
jgi:hypothetical protein